MLGAFDLYSVTSFELSSNEFYGNLLLAQGRNALLMKYMSRTLTLVNI